MFLQANSHTSIGLIFLIVLGAVFVLVFLRKHFKRIVLPNVFLVTGAVKKGKTALSLHFAIKTYKRNLREFYIKKFFATLIGLGFKFEYPPMLYTNIKIACVKHNRLTMDILLRKVQIPPKSVVFIDESSLLADSMLFKNEFINNNLMLFVKLYAHFTRGGTLIFNTQSVQDNHFAIRRCLGSYLYVYDNKRFPFISVFSVREMVYSSDNSVVNVVDRDFELDMRRVIIFNRTFKKYDRYCYYSIVSQLPYQVDYEVDNYKIGDDLRCEYLVSFQDFAREVNEILIKIYPDAVRDVEEIVEIENKEVNTDEEEQN